MIQSRFTKAAFWHKEVRGMKSPTFPLVATLLASALLIGCQQAPKLKVAVLASLLGAREGVQLAADEWNARGGALGRTIALIYENTNGSDPGSAAQAAKKVITEDHVNYIIGDIFSSLSIAVSDIANSAKVIQITPTSTNTDVTIDRSGATKAYVFRACFSDHFQGKVDAAFALNNLKARKAFVMVDPSDVYVNGLAEAFVDSFTKLGGAVVGREDYSGTDTDFSRTLAMIRSTKADVVYLPALSLQVVNLATKGAKEKGITATFIGGDGWDDTSLDPKASDGSYYTTHYRPDDPRPEVQSFVKAYRGKYSGDIPNFIAALSYDATNLLLTAIKKAGEDDTDKVRTALEQISISAVTGRITMDSQHNPIKGAVVLHVTGGKVVFDSFVSP
jgi:branched-chain amino acid transport system substrate-binding protein